jgi:hypothetical protein
VLAFLKRRWFLLALTFVWLGSSALHIDVRNTHLWDETQYGFIGGNFVWARTWSPGTPYMDTHTTQCSLQWPSIGGALRFQFGLFPEYGLIQIPLWLPLSVVIGWIVLREVRWREKMRAKEADA